MVDLTDVRFPFPDVMGQKVLVLGLGGGCDILTAYAFSQLLSPGSLSGIVYANTKTAISGPVDRLTAHIVKVRGPAIDPARRERGYGRCRIDHSVPRNEHGSPWIVLLDDQAAEDSLADEVLSLGFDLVIGVDTGGDSIACKRGRGHLGRDQRMLRVLQRAGLPLLHAVVAPGSDGEASFADLAGSFETRVAQGSYRGCFSLEPMLPLYRAFTPLLSPQRTPQIILAAAEGRLAGTADGRLRVPRGQNPVVPSFWLTTGFVFTPPGKGDHAAPHSHPAAR